MQYLADKFARCKLPADVGMCRGFAQKFFYDSADKECKPFTFGGCLGNANNFDSQQECLAACAPPVFEGISWTSLINVSIASHLFISRQS